MARPGTGRTPNVRRTSGLPLLFCGLLATASGGVLAPEWSLPVHAAVVSTAVGANTYSTEKLFLLLADGRVLSVSASDTLREVGRAPEAATALVALPMPPRNASDIALLLAVRTGAGASELVAWNQNGAQLWKSPIPGMTKVDSFLLVGEGENRIELCAWQRGQPWLVVVSRQLWQYSSTAVPLNLGFTPRDAFAADFDRDSVPELVFFDGARLAVHHVRQGRELHCEWPGLDAAPGPDSADRVPKPRIACAVFDSIPVLLAVTGDTLRYVNAMTGDEERRFAPGQESLAPATAVAARGPSAYAAGVDLERRCFLVKLGPKGPTRERSFLPLPTDAQVSGLVLLKDWPMLLVGTGYRPENLFLMAPGLAGSHNSPGYNGVRILRVIPFRIDEDTFPDIVVLRTSADARRRLDVFSNRMGQLAVELAQARRALLHAALGQNDNATRRAVRRMRELERQAGAGELGQERSVLDRFRATIRRRNELTVVGRLVVVLLSAGLGLAALVVLRRRHAAAAQQIENRPVTDRVALAADFIALDHNFVSKGNRPAAFERLIDIRNRHGLERDRDLGQPGGLSSQQLNVIYASAINRLVNSTATLPLLSFIQTTARSAPRGQEYEFLELSPEDLRRLERKPGARLIAVTNHEFPNYHRRFRIFANPEVRGTLEHIVLDHIRYAAKWAHIIMSYTVNTQWNRRLLIQFRSDSPNVVPFADPRAHITSQLRELGALLRPAIELPRDARALVGPHERLWLSFADYIAVLEETRSRLSVA